MQTQLWLTHSSPDGQLMQATPPVPQAASAVPGLQVPLSQQPLEQLAGVQTQVPLPLHWRPVEAQFTHGVPAVPQTWLERPV
ncbi:MAG: hypothetical protein LC708_00140 [Actinobacteria bacterium]|nr:hypothetical protein [Actinomycetota bacterium]